MKLPGAKTSFITSWILAIALTISPVLAQNPPVPDSSPAPADSKETTPDDQDNKKREAVPPLPDADPNAAATPDLNAATDTHAGPPFSTVDDASTSPISSSPGAVSQPAVSNPAESKWIITAAIVAGAVVVGIILLLRGIGGGGGHKSSTPPAAPPLGTVIGAGSPTVSAPSK
jgi:hypothetical protein